MKEQEKILKAFANRRRLAIVQFLKEKNEATVGTIAAKIRLSFKATSKHLHLLAAADIVAKEQQSLFVRYRLDPKLPRLARSIISNL